MPKKPAKKSAPGFVATILGCGTSVGVPIIGMQHLPQFKKEKNWRLRASILLEPFGRGGPAILVDTSPDLRQQAIRYFVKQPRLDAILLTHTHADHLHGLDDIRPFNFFQKQSLPLYAEPQALEDIRVKFSYIFHPYQEGGGVPRLELHAVQHEPFRLSGSADPRLQELEVVPLPVAHGRMTVLGFRVGKIAYVTDCSYISDTTIALMQGLEVLVLDCLRPKPHTTHLSVEQAIEYARRIGARKTVFTHMSWELEYEAFKKSLPRGMEPAYDGMRIRVGK
ncbi:MAG TPA: MBL fold metallo-hydrolase [Bdellovibrionota bacterium]|jgi:phosphoribosyl 1,2-cyclic phosphate phosphodiesterase